MKTCANLMRKICYNNKDRMQAGLICGGWDPYEGGQVYEIPLGTTIHYFNGETLWSKNRYFLLSFLSNSVIPIPSNFHNQSQYRFLKL